MARTHFSQLSDDTKAHLNAGTSLKYPMQFLKDMGRTVFIFGEAYFEVAKDTSYTFIVNVNILNVRVLGTQFNVKAYPEDGVAAIVFGRRFMIVDFSNQKSHTYD